MSEGDQTNKWQVQEAKARFSALVDNTLEYGPQIVTKRGVEAVVVVPFEQWLELEETEKSEARQKPRTLKDWSLAPGPRFELPIPTRRPSLRPRPVTFD